jgi:hypothetical protein
MLSSPETVKEILEQTISKIEMKYISGVDLYFLKNLLKLASQEKEALEKIEQELYEARPYNEE